MKKMSLLTFTILCIGFGAFAQTRPEDQTHLSQTGAAISNNHEINIGKTNLNSGQQNSTLAFTSSNLPIVIINTENRAPIVDNPKIKAYMGIIFNPNGQINKTTDSHNHYSGTIGIELRGNSTQGFPKKPYNLKTLDALGLKANVSLFGFPPENDWVLQASYLDHTFIRNPLAMQLSRLLGRWASRTQMVEVVLNSEYQGIYIFQEKIKVDKGRLDMASLNPNEITEPNISGGYIWEVTGFDNNLGEHRNLKYPEYSEAAREQIQYITQFDNNFRNSMLLANYPNETTGYPAWIDVDSFVDELIVQEAMRNSDAYGWSGYFHKDKGAKICAGPVWDFDQSAGNSSYPDDGVITGWMFSHPGTSNTPFFWPKLFKDPKFAYKVKLRWQNARQSNYKTEVLLHYVDSIANLLSVAQAREFQKWPVLGQNFWRETKGYQTRNTYAKEVAYLKDFLTKRWAWMDTELAKVKDITTDIDEVFALAETIKVYPNPAAEEIHFDFVAPSAKTCRISIFNSLGQQFHSKTYSVYTNGLNTKILTLENCPHGLLLYQIKLDDGTCYSGKFVKAE